MTFVQALTMTVFLPVVFCAGALGGGEMNTVSLATETALADVNRAIQRNNGIWQKVSTGFSVGLPGAIDVWAIGINQANGTVYWGGTFGEAGGNGDCNNIARWDGATLSPLGVGLDGSVLAIEVVPSGDVYVGGSFTDVTGGGGGTYSYIARWEGAAWNAVGAGLNGAVWDIKFNPHDGLLYICGAFTDVVGGAGGTYSYICTWDGSSYAAVGVGLGATARKMAIDQVGNVYVCGDFDDIADSSLDAAKIAKWDISSSSWSALGTSGLAVTLWSVAVGPDGTVYTTGDFDEIGGVTAGKIARYNGAAWEPLGKGLLTYGFSVYVAALDEIYVGGDFTTTDVRLADQIAVWDGKDWNHLDIDLPSSSIVLAINRYKLGNILYLGFDTAGTAYTSGDPTTTVTNDGVAISPRITISRSGGTTAIVEGIRNLTTGESIVIDYSLQDGETLTIDLTGKNKTMRNSINDNVLHDLNAIGSNLTAFHLAPGDNIIKTYVLTTGSPTLTAYMQWETHYAGADGAAQ